MFKTELEVTDLSGRGWVSVGRPISADEAFSLAKSHGDGFYCFSRYEAFRTVRHFMLISANTEIKWGPGKQTASEGDLSGTTTSEAHLKRATVAEAAEEFSRKCYKILIPAALRWKLELVFDCAAAFTALHKAIPGLPWKPYALADALTAAFLRRYGDYSQDGAGGVIPRECGDIAILTAKVQTISEIRAFLRNFAEEYLTVHG